MTKTKPTALTREAALADDASTLAKRLANERAYEGLPDADRKRIFEVSAALSDELGKLRMDISGKSDAVFSVYCGLKEMERELEEISGFFVRNYALIAELKVNRFVSGNEEMRGTLEKAEWRVDEMKKEGFDPVKAKLVDGELSKLSADAERVGELGNARKA